MGEDILAGYETNHKPFNIKPYIEEVSKNKIIKLKNPSENQEETMQYNGIKIIKRNDGRWEAKKQINGNRISICRNTQQEVYQELKRLFPKSETEKISKHLTLHQYIDIWYAKYKEPFLKHERQQTYKSIIKIHIKPNFPDKEINFYDLYEINLIIAKMPNTRQKEDTTQFIRSIFKYAYKDKKIKNNFYEDIIKYQHKREEGTALTTEQRKSIIKNAVKIPGGEIFICYLFTGGRASELIGLDINKDTTQNLIHLKGTKTDLSDRWIPMLKPIKQIVEKIKTTGKNIFKTSYETLKRKVNRLKELCGFEFQIKDFRTTYGTMLAEQGIQQEIISKWMGHTNTKTTSKYYIKILSENEQNQVNTFNNYFDDTFDDTFSTKTQILKNKMLYLVLTKTIKIQNIVFTIKK